MSGAPLPGFFYNMEGIPEMPVPHRAFQEGGEDGWRQTRGPWADRETVAGMLEAFQWYCLECNHLIYEVELQVTDIVKDLPPVFETFYASEEARTCASCGAIHPGKG